MDPMLEGVLDVVDTQEHQPPPEAPKTETVKSETKTETKTEEAPKSEPKTETETKTNTDAEDDGPEDNVEATQDFSRKLPDETETETTEAEDAPSKTETETQTEAETPEDDVKLDLPPPPEFKLEPPQVNENGEITNMTPAQYEQYIVEKAKHEFRVEAHVQTVENKALDAAEKILPEMKTNQAIRTMVENTRVASILNGKPINSFEAAKTVKEALGLTSTKIAEAKAQGAQNAKVSIQKQKTAAVETKGTTQKKSEPSARDRNLSKRLQMGDNEAFAELIEQWDQEGKL